MTSVIRLEFGGELLVQVRGIQHMPRRTSRKAEHSESVLKSMGKRWCCDKGNRNAVNMRVV